MSSDGGSRATITRGRSLLPMIELLYSIICACMTWKTIDEAANFEQFSVQLSPFQTFNMSNLYLNNAILAFKLKSLGAWPCQRTTKRKAGVSL